MIFLTTTAQNSSFSMIFFLVLIFIMMYFFFFRPQKKQQEERKKLMNGLKEGDHVVTIGGLHAKIDKIHDDKKTVTLDADGVYLIYDIRAINNVQTPAIESNVNKDVEKNDPSKENKN